jgi:phospholipase C
MSAVWGRPLSRRQVLAGGVAAGGGLALSTRFGRLIERASAATPTPCAPLSDIEHVVFLMQENRSFDHYFGTLSGVRGFDDPTVLKQANGLSVLAQQGWAAGKDPDGYLLPYHLDTKDLSTYAECVNDISHDYIPQHQSWNGGRMDHWVLSHLKSDGAAIGPITMGYYTREDLAFYYGLADAFTICDNYHCSVMGPTDPNRLYAMTGMLDPAGEYGGPILSTSTIRVDRQASLSWKTMPEALQEAGISWKVYQPPDGDVFNPLTYFKQFNDPTSPLFEAAFPVVNFPTAFQADIMSGSLPQVSWIMPSLIQSEHPAAPPIYGEVFVADALSALVANPAVWEKTVLFVTYDENGGFFDHVAPPAAPLGTEGEYLTAKKLPTITGGSAEQYLGPIGLGFRVPMLVLSPYSRGGLVSSEVFDHTSMLRFLETRFGVEPPNVTAWRRQTVGDLTGTLSLGVTPNVKVPAVPQPSLVDPAVLMECLPAGLSGTEDVGPTYPVPPNSMPHQEPGAARPQVVTAAAVCATAAPAAAQTSTSSTTGAPGAAQAAAGSSSAGGGGVLADTGTDPAIAVAGVGLAAAAVVARVVQRSQRQPDD